MTLNRSFMDTIEGVGIFSLDGDIHELTPDDYIIPGKFTALGVYYCHTGYPRFRTALSTDRSVDSSSAAVECSRFHDWLGNTTMVQYVALLFAHDGLCDDDFAAWEKEHVVLPFFRSQGADFLMRARQD